MPTLHFEDDTLVFEVPPHWEDRTVYSYVGPTETQDSDLPVPNEDLGFRPNLVTITEESFYSVEDYAAQQLKASLEELKGFEVTSEELLQLNGRSAIARTYTFNSPPDGVKVMGLQLFLPVGSRMATLTFSTLPEFFDEHRRRLFDPIVESIR